MSSYKVEICGVNTAKLPLLTEDEKKDLWKRIKAGDSQARETYIKGNLRLVLSVLKRFSNHSENMDDLFQIGCIGLMKSVDNFDPSMEVKFSTYAVPMIVGEIRRYLRDTGSSIRIPAPCGTPPTRPLWPGKISPGKNCSEPTLEEISKESGIEVEDIVYALDAMQSPLSLYDPSTTTAGIPCT